ncbi:MAG: TetR/AcrR family transcriptional regulator [Pseudomonadota bacterium]
MDNTTKRETVFEAATTVFSRYGFRRTSMSDIAEMAGISRPALYLLFENKEDLFRQLAMDRQNEAIDSASDILSKPGSLNDRVINALLTFERIYYEPVAQSPHGEELMDLSQSIVSEDMKAGLDRLIALLTQAVEDAISKGEADLSDKASTSRGFIELLMSSIGGQKKAAVSTKEFRRRVEDVASIFLSSITKKETG